MENIGKGCPHFDSCGGCQYQHLTYEEELALKESTIRQLLTPFFAPDEPDERDDEQDAPGRWDTTDARLSKGDRVFAGMVPAPSTEGYRNKMEFAFGDACKGGPLALGIRKRRSFYEVVTPEACTIIPADFRTILLTVLAFFQETDETFYHRKTHKGALRYLILRRGAFTGEVLVNLVTTSALGTPLAPLVERVMGLAAGSSLTGSSLTGSSLTGSSLTGTSLTGTVVGFLHTVNDSVADTVKNENVHLLAGRPYFYETLCGLRFKISAFSFFQTNSAGAERLYDIVRDYAASADLLYDLYCGTGTIAQILSHNAREVVGVELSAEAVAAAEENADGNGITNCTFIAGDVLLVLDDLAKSGQQPEVVVVDPPRDGLHPKALQKLLALHAGSTTKTGCTTTAGCTTMAGCTTTAQRVGRIVYVSCKPASLARDMAVFTQNGYRAEKIIGVDMFPRTGHVECVVLMSKSEN